MKKFILLLICLTLLFVSCNKENKKQDNNIEEQTENILTSDMDSTDNIWEIIEWGKREEVIIWDLLEEYNDSGVDDKMNYKENYLGISIALLAKINVDINATEGDTWLSGWSDYGGGALTFLVPYMHIIKEKNIIKKYKIPFGSTYSPDIMLEEYYEGLKNRQFEIFTNIPNRIYTGSWQYDDVNYKLVYMDYGKKTVWVYDTNNDSFDEIIIISDFFGEAEQGIDFCVMGYNKEKDEVIVYLLCKTYVIDADSGPEPVQYLQNDGVWGFRCLMKNTQYNAEYPIPAADNENLIWVFFTWDKDKEKYTERKFIE